VVGGVVDVVVAGWVDVVVVVGQEVLDPGTLHGCTSMISNWGR
jgi:hypothetical protein